MQGIPFKLTNAQRDKIMNDPLHYNLSMRFNTKDNMWEGETDGPTMTLIKAIVDEPAPPKE